MPKVAAVLLACLAAAAILPARSEASNCVNLRAQPLWVDVAGGPFWKKIWGRRGVVVGTGSISATGGLDVPTQLRAAGARTIYWDLYLRNRVGTPAAPADPAIVVERANRFFDHAARATRCASPLIGENELFGASTATPWTPANARYRANVLLFLQTLAARGATPFLAVPTRPFTDGEAGDWWREVSRVAHIVREVYVPAPLVHQRGPIAGSRFLRETYRRAVAELGSAGISARRVGLFLGFQTTRGRGGRDGLEPAQAWYRVVKLQALAAKQVAAEFGIASIWSWGWSSWRTTPQEMDPDKEAAACVYLWASRRRCDGPEAAGTGFDASLTEGQIRLSAGVQCGLGDATITNAGITALERVLGDRQAARTALFQRIVLQNHERLPRKSVLAAEQAIIDGFFGGNRASYLTAVRRGGATLALARAVIADELRRATIEARFRVQTPSLSDVQEYYASYGEMLARPVRVRPAAPWLDGRQSGLALAAAVPAKVLRLPAERWIRVPFATASYRVRALGPATPLARFPLATASSAIRAALKTFVRARRFDEWILRQERTALRQVICRRDDLPEVATVTVAEYLPFLQLSR